MACAVLLAGLPQHDQSMQRISGASSQRLLALGSLPTAPYLHCTDRSGMCRSHQIGNTCSLRSCVLAPASRSNGHPCWDHTWPLQSACPRRLDLERSQDHMRTPYQMSTRCCVSRLACKLCCVMELLLGRRPRVVVAPRAGSTSLIAACPSSTLHLTRQGEKPTPDACGMKAREDISE